MSYPDWLHHIFIAKDEESRFGIDDPEWSSVISPSLATAYIGRLFQESGSLLRLFSPAQIDRGLTTILSGGEWLHDLNDDRVPIEERCQAMSMLPIVFQDLFSQMLPNQMVQATDSLSPGAFFAYMFWDAAPFYHRSSGIAPSAAAVRQAAFDSACLAAMEAQLAIPHLASQESALHGLGHWHLHVPLIVESIIDGFLANGPHDPAIVLYAKSARLGCVL